MDDDHQDLFSSFEAIVQWSADAIVSTDMEHVVRSWNPAAERLFGFTADEIIGKSFDLTVLPEDIAWRRQLLAQLRVGEGIQRVEMVRVRRDGSHFDAEVTLSMFEGRDGRQGYACVLRDVSDRHAADDQLRALERLYRTFVERMPAITYITAPDGNEMPLRLLHISDRIEALIGYTTHEWADNEIFWKQIVHPDDVAALDEVNRSTTLSGEPYRAEYRMLARDGREVWVRDEAVLIRDEDGAPLYWLGFVIDISDLKRIEAEMVEALAGQRAANIELERVSAAKSEFLSRISHQFRTPLTSIRGFSELIASEDLEPDQVREFAETIGGNALRLSHLIDDLLNLDWLETGQAQLRREPVDLNAVTREVVLLLAPTNPKHNFIARFEPDLPLIMGDLELLLQVVTNLASNAVKYSPAGGDVIVTSGHDADVVCLSVEDQGIGIPEGELERIFSRHVRLERQEQKGIQGSGLGLQIARNIVEQHGGRIWAERASVGSRFRLELPRVCADSTENPG